MYMLIFYLCSLSSDDEGRDLMGKRGTEFKLPYPLIDCDMSGLTSPFEEDTKSKSPKSKKSKSQMREYLQAGRKRKTPYRDVYNGLNGYNPYVALNGYSHCQTGDVKPADLMFPYAGNSIGLESDLYRSTAYSTFPSSVYPHTDSLKHGYSNGYYLDARQYQHTLQYPANGYTDLVTPSAKYSYDIPKYGYDVGYGLDLAKRGYFDDEITRRYEQDLHTKYSQDLCNSEKYSKINGAFDTLKSTSLPAYNGTTTEDVNSYMNNSLTNSNTSYSAYPNMDKYNLSNNLSIKLDKLSNDSNISSPGEQQSVIHVSSQTSVIRNLSPRNKPESQAYHTQESQSVIAWPSCERASANQNKPLLTNGNPVASPDENMSSGSSSRIVSPIQSNGSAHSTGSVIKSVIQRSQKNR